MRDVMFGTLALLAYVVRFLSALFYAVAGLAIGIMAIVSIVVGGVAVGLDVLAKEMAGDGNDQG